MEVSDRRIRRARADFRAHFLGNRRNRGKSFRQGLEIKPGATHENRQQTCLLCLLLRNRSICKPKPCGIIDRAIDVAKQPMWRLGLVFTIGTRRQRAQIAVDLHRIGVDHHAAEGMGETKGQGRLAARCRPRDEEC